MAPFRVALTFDAEHPDRPAAAGQRGAAARRAGRGRDVRATFFVQGRWAEAYPATSPGASPTDGHLVGNHTLLPRADAAASATTGLATDIRDAEAAIVRARGVDPRPWFRCPFGAGARRPARLAAAVATLGYRARRLARRRRGLGARRGPARRARRRASSTGALARGDGASSCCTRGRTGTPCAPCPRSCARARRRRRRTFVSVADLPDPISRHPRRRSSSDRRGPRGRRRQLQDRRRARRRRRARCSRPSTARRSRTRRSGSTAGDRAARRARRPRPRRRPGSIAAAPADRSDRRPRLAGADYPARHPAARPRAPGDRADRGGRGRQRHVGALWAGLVGRWGIALICGEGINGAAVAPDGRQVRFDGVGDISGDWGGGHSVGMAGLAAAVRARRRARAADVALARSSPRTSGSRRPPP